ncbi:MAG: chemotaxis protein CheW [Bacteroidota bacterium]|nr:chemotaxis protein CheW [Bacteroidota bacterium]
MTKTKKKVINAHLVFEMFEESFAINVRSLLNILEMQKITVVPEAPSYMVGVINLRGEVLPVIDSHVKFGVKPLEITSETCILVLDIVSKNEEKIKLGLMVDYVREVLPILPESMLPPPGLGESYQSEYITGMYQRENKDFIMILDIDKLLSINEIIELNETREKNNSDVEKKIDVDDE